MILIMSNDGIDTLNRCVVSLIKPLYQLLSTGSTQGDNFRHDRKIIDYDVKNKKQ